MGRKRLRGTWTQLSLEILPVSSQTIASPEEGTAIVFSGELKPREPVQSDVHFIRLPSSVQDNTSAVYQRIARDNASPSPRVGAASAASNGKVYLVSGRAGKEFKPIDSTIHEFDGTSWHTVVPADRSPVPQPRSYHVMTAAAGHLFLHAGCAADGGRYNDLWAFDLTTKMWKELANAPGKERGGTSLIASRDETKLFRIGGFDGKQEIGGIIDIYDISQNSWTSINYANGPIARSVAVLTAVLVGERQYLVYAFGEADPSKIGHEGAGKFLKDTWVFDIEKSDWSELDCSDEHKPSARGWLGAVACADDTVLIQGGLNEDNNRLGDWWLLKLNTT
ncbi:kelch repeat protein [Viridothelium virens]|uniref:Kelch repeat protein n=1 Tax=Viridothelium virens TaxID=1048519 RepID=A0A6A6GZ21_VIRVR|nr:kelch repeat protein [Viridothelium virens]